MESHRSNSIESINRLLHTILSFPVSLRQVLASPDRELAPQISQSRKFPPALSSMKIWSDWAIKTALRSVRCPLQHIQTSAESVHSFPERWALQVARCRGKWEITDIHPVLPTIDGISPFQMHRIHRHTILQYPPDRCGPSTWSGLS